MDLLDFILGVYIVQKHEDKIQHPIAYYSKKLIPLELNYNIYNKELLAIVIVLKEQRVFLQRIIELFIIKTDYKNLIKFLTTKKLNYRQVRWAEILIEYYAQIKMGRLNTITQN